MNDRFSELLDGFDPETDLTAARTPPAAWYFDPEIAAAEAATVFSSSWQLVARRDQLNRPGNYVTADIAGEPVVVVCDADATIRGFYNVCRHHAAQVAVGPSGSVRALHCPYHGWTYNLDGTLRSAPHFEGAAPLEPMDRSLQPVRVAMWRDWVFACLDPDAQGLDDFLTGLEQRLSGLDAGRLDHHQRVTYELDCNWKVFVDNYLDGGYHVPYLHRELAGALDVRQYRIEVGERFCLQTCPTADPGPAAGAVRGGLAWYLWIYPNLMLNYYDGLMDMNLVLPSGPERCIVHFDYFFADQDAAFRDASMEVADRVQREDVGICEAVQRGLRSRSYDTGRLSPDREAGERRFHQLLHGDLRGAAERLMSPAGAAGSGRSVRRNPCD
jgi:choline monooxygenase